MKPLTLDNDPPHWHFSSLIGRPGELQIKGTSNFCHTQRPQIIQVPARKHGEVHDRRRRPQKLVALVPAKVAKELLLNERTEDSYSDLLVAPSPPLVRKV